MTSYSHFARAPRDRWFRDRDGVLCIGKPYDDARRYEFRYDKLLESGEKISKVEWEDVNGVTMSEEVVAEDRFSVRVVGCGEAVAEITTLRAPETFEDLYALCNDLKAMHNAHRADLTRHEAAGGTIISAAAATTPATLATLLAELKTNINEHFASDPAHYVVDSTNTISAAAGSTYALTIALAVAVRNAWLAHTQDVDHGFHTSAPDSTNVLTSLTRVLHDHRRWRNTDPGSFELSGNDYGG